MAWKVALVAPDDWTLWLFYRHLIAELRDAGASITAFSSAGPHISRLADLGVVHRAVPYERFVSPRRDLELLRALRRAFRSERFDVVQNFTVKANLYGSMAAHAARVPSIINTVEGAGLLYSPAPSRRVRAIRAVVETGLRRMRPHVSRYWFVNEHDRDTFVERRLATVEQSRVAIATGVDTDQFDPDAIDESTTDAFRSELGIPARVPLVTLVVGRLLRSKGVAEFIEMAANLRHNEVDALALLVGPAEPTNLDALPQAVLEEAVAAGVVRWVPFRADIPTVYAASTIVLATTYYAEGTPKSVMEGMAMGRAVVASDLPSTRPLIRNGHDGILVPARSVSHLTDAVSRLLLDRTERDALGREARRAAVERMDAHKVARLGMQTVYGGLAEQSKAARPNR